MVEHSARDHEVVGSNPASSIFSCLTFLYNKNSRVSLKEVHHYEIIWKLKNTFWAAWAEEGLISSDWVKHNFKLMRDVLHRDGWDVRNCHQQVIALATVSLVCGLEILENPDLKPRPLDDVILTDRQAWLGCNGTISLLGTSRNSPIVVQSPNFPGNYPTNIL